MIGVIATFALTPPDAAAGITVGAPCASPPSTATVTFSDVTAAQGLVDPLLGMMVHAVAWGDVNRDGWTDVFVGSFGDRPSVEYQSRGAAAPAPDRLLLGGPTGFQPDPTFPTISGRTSSALIVDLDGDNWPELVVGRTPKASGSAAAVAPSLILANDGSGRFGQPITLSTTLGTRTIAVLDVDGNPLPDLFLASDRWDRHPGSALLRNEGELEFTDVTATVGLPTDLHALGAAAADLDGDTWTDLVTTGTNATGSGSARAVRVFRGAPGIGGLRFTEVVDDDFVWTTSDADDEAAGVVAADLNRDGRLDLVVGQHWGSTLRYSGTGNAQVATPTGVTAPIRLYLNTGEPADGPAGFRDVTAVSGLPAFGTKSPDVQVADFDNDGWPDILTTASSDSGTRPTVLHNLGNDPDGVPRFSTPTGIGGAQYWVQGPLADVDRDGRVEPLLAEWYPRLPSVMLHNDTAGGHWLGVVVTPSTVGYGARVNVYCAGGLGDVASLIGTTTVSPASGYSAGIEAVARFGLGAVDSVDVRIELRNGGGTLDLRGVRADQVVNATAPVPSTALLRPSVTRGLTPISVSFGMVATVPSPDVVTSWRLDFGDGSPPATGLGAPPSEVVHTYVTPGATPLLAHFEVTDSSGRVTKSDRMLTFGALPGAPRITRVASDIQRIAVEVSAPVEPGVGVTPTGYTTRCFSSNGGIPGSTTGVGPTLVVTGLSAGATYRCTATATTDLGSGPESGASAAATVPNVPGAPRVTSVAAGSRRLTVNAAAPTVNGGRPISGYEAQCTSTNGGATRTATAAKPPVVVTGVTAGRTYRCTVWARNVVGKGPASAPSGAVVPRA
ncbi:MAG: FG-GAP-like repeat-containing protein [Actinomycetota bacterium]